MRRRNIITAVLVAGTLTAAGPASAQDLRSPDARDQSRQTPAGLDVRSPDAREGGDVAEFWGSPLSRVYEDTLPAGPTAPTGSAVPAQIVAGDDAGFDFGSATVGAIAALVLAGAGVALSGGRRRRTAAPIA